MENKNETFHLEDAFQELEKIINQLEQEELPLKDAIELYGKGAKLVSDCKEELSGIEKEMIVITDSMVTNQE